MQREKLSCTGNYAGKARAQALLPLPSLAFALKLGPAHHRVIGPQQCFNPHVSPIKLCAGKADRLFPGAYFAPEDIALVTHLPRLSLVAHRVHTALNSGELGFYRPRLSSTPGVAAL